MPVDGPVPWPLAEHTAAKHDIYRTYLAKWFPILLAKKKKPFPSVTYVEGFAGPGIYVGGQPGSPILAIRALVNEVPPDRGVAKFVFVDDDPRCIELLRQQLRSAFTARPRSLESMLVEIQCGTCAIKLESSLDKLQAWDKPIFAVFDSWGNVPVPYQLFQRLAANIAQLAPLGRLLASRLVTTGRVRVRVEDLRTFALLETIFRPEHVISALQVLKESGQLIVEGGGRLQRSSFVSTAPSRGGL